MTDASLHIPTRSVPADQAGLGDYWQLLKPRLMSLSVFTALVGLLVAPGTPHPILGAASILWIALGAGASGALNMWFDADIDRVMKRTRKRPIPAGRVAPGDALALGLFLTGVSVVMLGLTANWVAAGWLAFTIFFYAVIYSMWLKRTTSWNTVIGGLAGAFPPMIGWAAATGATPLEAWLLVGLIFMWTPPHFWALALFVKLDYHEARIPMLTVTHGREETRRQALLYSVGLAIVSIWVATTSIGGPLTLAVAVVLNAVFVKRAWDMFRRSDAASEADGHAVEKGLFKWSLFYLFAHFSVFVIEAALGPWGGW
ncbi:heme o synthase [Jannaschia seohaensis]|uniref:Protoheme IX farnesyltransferase n=1 Tax=Jannaschia seohaensis TaxID=475081 RepID=A0A2Y9C3X3_9RHOB|nr:heme o synthase [Jannaschia seohaensis]PWJ22295.1 protoheme IX farnesyltransferase [Jannaschia seohaensis]SSA38573.1 protoheme IX farnesyltransferase [Jannaschia seohaensis]